MKTQTLERLNRPATGTPPGWRVLPRIIPTVTTRWYLSTAQRAKIAAVQAAITEKSRLKDLNEHARLNAKRGDAPWVNLTISEEQKRLLNAEKFRVEALANISPENWRQRVESLPEDLRVVVACVIWWDFFSQRTSADRWSELDSYTDLGLTKVPDVHPATLAAALITCGYSAYAASMRSTPPAGLTHRALAERTDEVLARVDTDETPAATEASEHLAAAGGAL